MESPRRSRPRAGAAARGEEPTQEQGAGGSCRPGGTRAGAVCSWGMDPVGRSRVGAVPEELLPVGSPRRLSSEGRHPVGGTRVGQGERGTVREQRGRSLRD